MHKEIIMSDIDIDFRKIEVQLQNYNICVDQDFIDTYYIVLREFSSDDPVIKNMKKMFEKYASHYVKVFDMYYLKRDCISITRPSHGVVENSDYQSFMYHIIPFYMRNMNRYDDTFVMIGEKNNKKRYIIKLSFNDIVYLNTISASVGGSVFGSSRYLFSDGFDMPGPVVTNHVFGCNSYIRSGDSTSVYFYDNVIDYIKKHSNDHE